MKILSINFLTCAVKACKSTSSSYPLHPKDAELVQDDLEVNAELLINLLPRLDWKALTTTATEVCSLLSLSHSAFPFLPWYGFPSCLPYPFPRPPDSTGCGQL
jgi:hypothetical protein